MSPPSVYFWLPCVACTCEILSSPKQGLNLGPSAGSAEPSPPDCQGSPPSLISNYSNPSGVSGLSTSSLGCQAVCSLSMCLSVSLHLLSIHPPIIIINLSSLLSIGHPSLSSFRISVYIIYFSRYNSHKGMPF